MDLLIKNCLILPMTEPIGVPAYYEGAVAVRGNRIVFVSGAREEIERFENGQGAGMELLDARGMLVMPGLINLHNHVSMTLMRGYADDMPLMPWLQEKIWPFEAKLRGEDIYWGAQLGMTEMLLGGTTAFVDMYWHADRVADAAIETGIRTVVSPPFVEGVFEGYMKQAAEVITRYNGAANDRIRVWVAPHAPYTCLPDQIRQAVTLCDTYDVGIHTHLAETLIEEEIIRSRYGQTPVEYMRDLGVFDRRSMAVHCVHLTPSDMDILGHYGVSVAHNPQSNMKLASGISPVAQLLQRGINVGIGTDGPSSNNDLDLWEEMRTASLLQKVTVGDPCVLPAYEVLRMATVHGAKAIGMEGELGVIAVGARADLVLIDLQKPHLTPSYDLIANLVYCGKASDVNTVLVDGEVVVRNGVLTRVDPEKIRRQVDQCLESIRNRSCDI